MWLVIDSYEEAIILGGAKTESDAFELAISLIEEKAYEDFLSELHWYSTIYDTIENVARDCWASAWDEYAPYLMIDCPPFVY